MLRFASALLLLCLTVNANAADSYITRLLNKPVPGGVAVIELGSGVQAPKATYLACHRGYSVNGQTRYSIHQRRRP